MDNKEVEIGSGQSVTIDKLFGPMIFANLRVTANTERGEWVIEREWIGSGRYIEWCSIPAQIDEEFKEHDQDAPTGEGER